MRTASMLAPWGPLLLDVDVATSPLERMKGWMGRSNIAPRDALLIQPCNSVHTFLMRHPIDVVFLDRVGRVLAVHARVAAGRMRGHWRAAAALELCAGRALELGIEPGLTLRLSAPAAP